MSWEWIVGGALAWTVAALGAWALCRAAARADISEEELARELRQRKRQRRYAPTTVRGGGHGVRVHSSREEERA